MRKKSKFVHGVGINDYTGPIKETLTCYETWSNMLGRCYDPRIQHISPTYVGCTVCTEWMMFSKFKRWYDENFKEGFDLDKDLLFPGNRIYSPRTCRFVPRYLNTLFGKGRRRKSKTNLPLGVHINNGYPIAQCNDGEGNILSKCCTTVTEAHIWYNTTKTNVIKKQAARAFSEKSIDIDLYRSILSTNFCTAVQACTCTKKDNNMIDMTDLLITELPLAATPDTFQLPPPSPEEAAALAKMGTLSFSPTAPVTEDVPPSVPAGYQDPDSTLDALLHQPTASKAFQVPPSAKEEPSLVTLVLSLQQQVADLTALVRSQQETLYSAIEETVQEAMVQMLPPSVLHQEPLSPDDQAAVDSFSVPDVPSINTGVQAVQEKSVQDDVPDIQSVHDAVVQDNPLFVQEVVQAVQPEDLKVSVLGDGRYRTRYSDKQYNSHRGETKEDFVSRIVTLINKNNEEA